MDENTMYDLRREVATRVRDALHGKEVDMMESVKPRLPHMLGITPLGEVHDPTNEEMTLLDPSHPFWTQYDETVNTRNAAVDRIMTALGSLREDEIIRLTYPYGEEADIIYCEIDEMSEETDSDQTIKTTCRECGAHLSTPIDLVQSNGHYYINVSLDCPECEFSGNYRTNLVRQ